ncbi:GNAT family N-acetyltransferase [Paenibacillus sp. MCAF9]|uniref:GNAT family N-acetyltransferase n=1 Tax=Paenibacillus sp. MCAF9 TaxID=3233046 RepID=UPI003F9E5707
MDHRKIRTRLNEYFLIAEIDHKIIGYCFGDVREGNAQPVIKHDEKYLEIFEVYVDPDFRSLGIGRKLVEHLIFKSNSNKVSRILVGSSNRKWEETIRFYKDQGFQMWYFQMYK